MNLNSSLRNKLLLVVVYIGLLLDYSLLTAVEPILPAFFLESSTSNSSQSQRHDQILDENLRLGFLVGSKCLVQVFAQPLIGPLTTRIGFSVPLFFGYLIMIFSTLLFAFGKSYLILFLARAVQGIGSACAATGGMGMLAQQYSDDKQRARYMGIAMGGMALGLLIGAPYGGAMYDIFHGKEICFLILAGLGVLGVGLQLLVLPPKLEFHEHTSESTSMRKLLMDPRILIAAGSIFVGNLGLGVLSPGLQLWMVDKWNSSAFELGVVFFPSSLAYLIGTTFVPSISIKLGRWRCVLFALPIIAICLSFVSFAPAIFWLFIPITVIGICISFIDSAMIPLITHMAYIKHKDETGAKFDESSSDDEIFSGESRKTVFTEKSQLLSNEKLKDDLSMAFTANAYAISDAGLSIAFFIAPFASGPLVQTIGFQWTTWAFAIGILCFAPLALLLRKPSKGERLQETSITSSVTKM